MSIIEVRDVKRLYETDTGWFRRKKAVVEALRDVSFSVQEGEIFGLIGPNGAGKTTTIKILTTLLIPTSGHVRVLGLNPVTQHRELRTQINFIFGGERNLYWRLSAYDNLAYFADLYRVPRHVQRKRLPELLDLVGLTDVAERKVETFSKGMKQKLQIARGLVNQPRVLFLDEPTIGLDPVSARQLRTILRDLNQQGTTIVHTTHYMYEADELCNRIAFLNHGQVVALDTPAALKSVTNQYTAVECVVERVSSDELHTIQTLHGTSGMQAEARDESVFVRFYTSNPEEVIPMLYASVSPGTVKSINISAPTLEDAYVQLAGGAV